MFVVYGIHSDGREEGHTECASLDDAFMHLHEMLASEVSDPNGSIFAAYAFRMVPHNVSAVVEAEPCGTERPPSRRWLASRPPTRQEMMAQLPVSNTVISEKSRQAILLAASQAKPRQRHARTQTPRRIDGLLRRG